MVENSACRVFLERASAAAHLNSTQWRTTLLQRPPKWQHMSEGLQSVLPRPLTRLGGLSSRPLRRALNYWTRTSKECCFVQVSVFLLYFASLKIFARCCFYTGAQNLWEKVAGKRERFAILQSLIESNMGHLQKRQAAKKTWLQLECRSYSNEHLQVWLVF